MADKFDVIIVGGGPGGYVAAIRAAQLGFNTALVEGKHLGGICLNWGCIPTKALLRSADILHHMQHGSDYGLSAENISFDLAKIVKRSRDVSAQLNKGVQFLMKKNKITVYDGYGQLDNKKQVIVSKDKKQIATLTGAHIILATGARARELPDYKPDGKLVWTYHEAMIPETLPKKLLVVGSGAIGVEFASFYNALGVEVTILEIAPQILPVEDAEIAAMARGLFEKRGMKIHTNVKLGKLTKAGDSVTLDVTIGKETQAMTADRLIMAVGVVGNVENLGLETLGIKTDRNCIIADEFSRTNVKGVYAIGDVAGAPMLAHKAEHEGVICIEKIAQESKMGGIEKAHITPLNKAQIPGCTYCSPQIASLGMTEEQAKQAGKKVKIGRFPFVGNGKAIAMGETDGMVKTIFDEKTGELLGAHLIGAEVTELIQGFVVAMGLETTEAELMETIFPHPTLSEMMHESVLSAYGKAIHI
ncbi:MAG: dihydrolipoyl dehydrogenase [Alphaproteobacteria bacterium]|nr:dihydrolipoyl dehydrogenase [Alphaproteobacteria bacterium]